MKRHVVGALSCMFIAFECFGGFGSGTIIKTLTERGNSKEAFKKSMAVDMLFKRSTPVSIPSYDNFTNASEFPYYEQLRRPLSKIITFKEQKSKIVIGIKFIKDQMDSLNFDIICDPSQKFYEGCSYNCCYPISASSLIEGDSLVCLKGTDITTKKIKKIYTIHNDEGSIFTPQTEDYLWIPVSKFGVISYVPSTVTIKEKK